MAEPIAIAQNQPDMLRLLLAQRKLYSDAKAMQNTRLAIVFAGAAAGSTVAVLAPTAVTVISLLVGVGLIMYSAFGTVREKTKAKQAATVQELFDCEVLHLDWNDVCARRPTPQVIATAVTRSSADVAKLRDWYPSTASVPRPFNVLICQRSNVGWGASMHTLWAAVLTAATVVLTALIILFYFWRKLPFITLVPLLGPLGEAVNQIRAHRDSSTTKQSLEDTIMSLWRRALADPQDVGEPQLRRVQDLILGLRQTNAHVPDWFYNWRRVANETTMQDAADALVREVQGRAGL